MGPDEMLQRMRYGYVTPDGNSLEWIERTASGENHYDTEPETDWSTRMGVDLLSILPIEWLL
jgi:cardiolipin synthase C